MFAWPPRRADLPTVPGGYRKFINGKGMRRDMSFFDNTRNFGMLAMIVAAVNVVGSVLFFFNDDIEEVWRIVAGIGGILSALLMLAAGFAIFSGRIPGFLIKLFPDGATSKFGVLTGYTAAIGVASIIGLGFTVADIVIGIIVGILLLFVVWILTNDRKGVVEKILWVILMVFYFLGILGGVIIAITGGMNLVSGICISLMYLLAFVYLFDPSVKRKFGM